MEINRTLDPKEIAPRKRLSLPNRAMLAALSLFALTGCSSPITKTPDLTQDQAKALCDNRANNYFPYQQQNGIELLLKGNTHGFGLAHQELGSTPDLPDDNQTHIFTKNLKTGEVKNLQLVGSEPTLSPDGMQFAYYTMFDTKPGISVANIDGSNSKQIYQASKIDDEDIVDLAWSHDGKLLAFNRTFPLGNRDSEIGIITPDGKTQASSVVKDSTDLIGMSWSPVENVLTFSSENSKLRDFQIYTTSVILSKLSNYPDEIFANKPKVITSSVSDIFNSLLDRNAVYPKFSQDGRTITFERTSDPNSPSHVFALQTTGGSEKDITSICK
jgi:Tol biopolymer transport system component